MSEGALPLAASAPLLASANFLSPHLYPDHVLFAEDGGGGGEPEGNEAFRVVNGRRSARDFAEAENANEEWRLVVQMNTGRAANFIALDRGHNLEGVTVDLEGDDDPNFSSPTTIFSVTIPSSVTSPTDVTEAPGAKTHEGAWLYFFGNTTEYENYRLVVPALGAGLKQKVVGAFVGFAWEPEHASILSYQPSGPDLALRETVSDTLWAAAAKPIIRRHGSIRIAAATSADRANARTYVERQVWRYYPVWWVPFANRGEESWLGRVPSGQYVFRRTTEWPLGETTFSLKEVEPDTRSLFTLPSFPDDTPEGSFDYSIERTTSGLVVEDDFDRPDSDDLDNNWTEFNESASTQLRIETNQVLAAAAARRLVGLQPTDQVGDDEDVVAQINAIINSAVSDNLAGVRLRSSSLTNGYNFRMDTRSGGVWGIVRNSSTIIASSTSDPPARNEWRGLRAVIEGTVLRLYATDPLADGEDLSEDFVLRTSVDDSGSIIDNANRIGFDRDAIGVECLFDTFFVCGREITVTGIPTGWKIQVDARSAVTETGGSVAIDIETWALPATEIKLLDETDAEQASLTPSGGIYGGDVYEVSTS